MFDPELLQKRAELLQAGVNPYPYSFERSHHLAEVRAKQSELLGQAVRVAGRLVAYRGKGKLIFADLGDFHGRLQVMFTKDAFDEATWEHIRRRLDLGDWLGVSGPVFVTKMGEMTVEAKSCEILAKTTVRVPIPKEKDDRTFFQLADPETKYRERYLHWITDPAARAVMVTRARVISSIRRFLEERGFI